MADVFRSLVATVKLQPELDNALEAKAVKLLLFVTQKRHRLADTFLGSLASPSDDSLTTFIQCIVVLISSASKRIITTTKEMLYSLFSNCSPHVRLALVKADLIPQLISTLNPLSLSFVETVDIHVYLMKIIWFSLGLSTPVGLEQLQIEDNDEQQAVHETIFQQVLSPYEQYFGLLCVNRCSIVDVEQSRYFLNLLATLLEISPHHQPTMELVLNMPVFLTIPSYLTFFDSERSIWSFLYEMVDIQREWNTKGGVVGQMWRRMHRMLRKEGIEDVMEEKLRNAQNGNYADSIVVCSSAWNNQLGMNLPE
ncbi:hypothetical protein BLNAU_23089 [Blattamonas nauphoetae]|uniref:Uncharacterized protein n=1 Tax=Blattamonas nauphoetae TaxID=2049346 RepID=A0ABQ9WR83_9EUKA|nr:hypothetical protein BLNAU_23089 [Blattamonas nauphoetae]